MIQIGKPINAVRRGFGWKASENFADTPRENRSAQRLRENRLKAAIRRIAMKTDARG